MANREHLAILRQGVEVWNIWRERNPEVRSDLSLAKLSGANLPHADLTGANLSEANLTGANLSEANLTGANLSRADLSEANLSYTNLSKANLSEANLSYTNLSKANLSEALAGKTVFGNIDLRTVKALETIIHSGPSTIGTDTLERSQGEISEAFLRRVGLSDSFITYARSLVSKPIDYYSLFISYSSQDQQAADRLYADLQRKGIRCWYAPHDMVIGEKIRDSIDLSIRRYEKLLLIFSENAVESTWVESEVETALEIERQAKEHRMPRQVLFPIRLDDSVLTTSRAWAKEICRRHIGDFTRWKDHDAYQRAFGQVLRDLRTRKPDEDTSLPVTKG